MNAVVTTEILDGVLVVHIDNPPVNALGHAVRQGLSDAIALASADTAVNAVVIIGAGRTFPAGADIKEFGKPLAAPGLPTVCQTIEDCGKPVIAALHGTALGGGLEVALAAHYRIALDNARMGLPEVNLGILPGAGGTQRMPRLTGAGPALDVMLSGKPIGAAKALEIGLIDAVVADDLPGAALEFSKAVLAENKPVVRTQDRRDGLDDKAGNNAAIEDHKKVLKKRARGLLSPFRIVECVQAALALPFDEGITLERDLFVECLQSDQSKGLIHAFFAERQSAKIPETTRAKPHTVNSVGVIGGGTMGAGISVALLDAGLPVVMIERDKNALRLGQERVANTYSAMVRRGRITEAQQADYMGNFSGALDYSALANVDLVIEAVFEDMTVKHAVFAQLDKVLKPSAVIATNTSYLDINEMAAATSRPGNVIGLHFFSPANIMKLLEVIVPDHVSDDVVVTGFALAKALGKIPVRAGVCDGFIGNRLLSRYRQATDHMMEDGASPYDIDAALFAFGFAMGPYRVSDLAGGDIGWATRKRLAPTRDPAARYVEIPDRICKNGWFGQKTGRGYYRYPDGPRSATPDPEVLAIIDAERARLGIIPREFAGNEIQRRSIAAIVNEAARVLAEGIAQRPSDIDAVLIHGYGFPRHRGGPMKYADMVGLENVLADIQDFAAGDALFWQPAPLLIDLVKSGSRFDALNKKE